MELKYLVLDVDGTMTDGGIYYDEHGNELKKFNTRDAAGIFAALSAGIEVLVVTGRECKATEKRMKELGVKLLYQNIKDKTSFLQDFMQEHNVNKRELGYIGDDLNDLRPMQLAGFVACPCDGCDEIKAIANYISKVKGGDGVIRDVVMFLLRPSGLWSECVTKVYSIGI